MIKYIGFYVYHRSCQLWSPVTVRSRCSRYGTAVLNGDRLRTAKRDDAYVPLPLPLAKDRSQHHPTSRPPPRPCGGVYDRTTSSRGVCHLREGTTRSQDEKNPPRHASYAVVVVSEQRILRTAGQPIWLLLSKLTLATLFTGRDSTRGSDQEVFKISRVGSGRVGSGRAGSGRVESGYKVFKNSTLRVRSGKVRSSRAR